MEARFWNKVLKTNSCWLWQASLRNGYGAFKIDGKVYGAHVVSMEMASGKKVPPGVFVCHTCDVRQCVNPSHLWLGTHSQNMIDAAKKGRLFMPNPKIYATALERKRVGYRRYYKKNRERILERKRQTRLKKLSECSAGD